MVADGNDEASENRTKVTPRFSGARAAPLCAMEEKMILHWPQITYLALSILGVGASLAKNGEPRTGNYNFWVSAIATCGIIFLLKMGGFFG